MPTHLDLTLMSADELVAAYLDNELDAAARLAVDERLNPGITFCDRLIFLVFNSVPMDAAFTTPLDDAPVERIKSKLPVLGHISLE